VTHDVKALLGSFGVARTREVVAAVDRHTIGAWVSSGRLLRPYPGVVVLPERSTDWRTRAIAAALATRGVLSHTSALTVWRLAPAAGSIHVSVPPARRALRRPGLVVHRVTDIPADQLGPYPVTDLPRALVDSWGLAARSGRVREVEIARGAVIACLRDRRVPPADVHREIARRPTVAGARSLGELVRLVSDGCQSELEIWGVRHVLERPGMPRFVHQLRVRLPSGAVYLDAAVTELQVDVELDGAAFHGSADDRERDTRRDVALAALGWVVLRFSYRRLTTDPDGCRREIQAVCAARRELLRP
jgi:very-short-patch-repair endonuclease